MLSAVHGQDPPKPGTAPPDRPRSRPPSELTGWADWEKAAELLKRIDVPPAPVLSPDEALKTFTLAPGYRLELVAAEPLVNTPIFFEFDPDGRIWVVEYQGYMRDLQGSGEGDSICRIVVLEDTDEDGRADKTTVFLDRLVMPRSLAFVKGGVLIAEPPHLWFCPDADGDLRCDQKLRVGGYGRGGNPQHTANGLRYGLDNWLHSADIAARHRFVEGKLIEEDVIPRGQFGVTFDDEGRFFTCRENRALIADLIPAEYFSNYPALVQSYLRSGRRQTAFGVNVDIAPGSAQQVFPSRVTPAVTLGALELRDDGRLATYTVVSGTGFYNGHQFPADAYGNMFVPESGGHLVGRLKLTGDIDLRASRFYPEGQEFLTSTDERFRPVNSRVGPDGALYIADMYRGIIEHVIFMVPYLDRQIRDRKLDQGLNRGRIYRIVYDGNPIDRRSPRLSRASTPQLLAHLGHANGWWRLTAQRLLVERRDPQALPALRDLARNGSHPLGRLHALWTLQGLQAIDRALLIEAMSDRDDRVRGAAIRLSERLDASAQGAVLRQLTGLSTDASARVRLQGTLTAGRSPAPGAIDLVVALHRANREPLFRAAVMTGLRGRELTFLQRVLETGGPADPGDRESARWIAELIMREGDPLQVEQLLAVVAGAATPLLQHALLEGMTDAIPSPTTRVSPIALSREPLVLRELLRSGDLRIKQQVRRLHTALTWPGVSTLPLETVDATPLSPDDRRLAERGETSYGTVCAACHRLDGGGLPQVAPPLADSEWVAGPSEPLIKIVLHGLYGPLEVQGVAWNRHMPGLGGALGDEEVAGVLTYIRRAWGNRAAPVRPDDVRTVRRDTASRAMAWAAQELAFSPPATTAPAAPVIRPGQDGQLHLPARLAVTYGRELAYRPSLDIVAPWRHEHDVAEWYVEVPRSGRYEVWVTLAADDASAGDHFVIASPHGQARGVVLASGGYDTFREYSCGVFDLTQGANRIVMRPDGPLKRELADVRSLRLVPVAARTP